MVISRKALKLIHHKLFFLLVALLPVQLAFHFWPDWSTVFGIRVDYLSPTVYLTDIIVVGILVSWVIGGLRGKRLDKLAFKKLSQPPFNYFLFAISYLLITSIFIAQNPGAALYKSAKILEFFFLGLYVFINHQALRSKYLTLSLSVAIFYSSIIAWGQFLVGHSIGESLWWLGERTFSVSTPGIALVTIGGQDYLRPYATFPHPNVLAGFLLVGIIFLLSGRRNFRFLTSASIVLGILAIVISFSQAVWLASMVLIIITLPIIRKRLTFLANLILGLVIAGSIILPLLPTDTTQSLPQEISQRIILAKAAGDMFLDYPLFGVGLNNFVVKLPQHISPATAWLLQPVHNLSLLILAETGLAGLIFLGWFLIKALKRFSNLSSQFPIALLAVLLTGFFDHYWLTLQQTQLLFVVVVALIFSKSRPANPTKL